MCVCIVAFEFEGAGQIFDFHVQLMSHANMLLFVPLVLVKGKPTNPALASTPSSSKTPMTDQSQYNLLSPLKVLNRQCHFFCFCYTCKMSGFIIKR